MKTALLLVVSLLLLLPAHAVNAADPAASPALADPAATVQALYDYHRKHYALSNEQTVKANKPLFAPALYTALAAEFRKPVAKGDAPDLDWDILCDTQETAGNFRLGKAAIHNATARVEVTLVSPNVDAKGSVVVSLVQVDHAWKISDFYYPASKTTLTTLLKALLKAK